jgi:ABC-2 type transport system permease protein
MRVLRETTWLELKLLFREPLTVIFSLALPVLVLFVLGGVFGNTPDPEGEVFRGVGAMTYYVPAYVGLVLASMGLVGLPAHLAGYREHGVLRRWHASSMPVWAILAAQVVVTLVVAVAGAVLVVTLGWLTYEVETPVDLLGVVVAFLVGGLAFAAVGVLLGSVLPTARAAQGAGILLWFVMMIIGGAGPPPEVLTDVMRTVAGFTPLRHVILAIQDPWLGLGWNGAELLVVAGIMVVCAGISLRFFRWN